MKKILFGFILISLCVLISSCESNQCDCEIVTSNYNYTTGEWEEIDRYFHEQDFDDGGCADRVILSTGDFDTISITHYNTERLSGYLEELDCPMYYN